MSQLFCFKAACQPKGPCQALPVQPRGGEQWMARTSATSHSPPVQSVYWGEVVPRGRGGALQPPVSRVRGGGASQGWGWQVGGWGCQMWGVCGGAREPPGAPWVLGAPGLNTETPAPLSSCPLPLCSRLLPRLSVQVTPRTKRLYRGRKRQEEEGGKEGLDRLCWIDVAAWAEVCRRNQGREGARAGPGGGSGDSAAPGARAANKRVGLSSSGLSGDGSLSP